MWENSIKMDPGETVWGVMKGMARSEGPATDITSAVKEIQLL